MTWGAAWNCRSGGVGAKMMLVSWGKDRKAQSVDAWLLWGLPAARQRGASGRKQGQGGWGTAGHDRKDRGRGQTSEGLIWRLRSLALPGRQ